MTDSHDCDEPLFDARRYRAEMGPDLLDQLAEIERVDSSLSEVGISTEPWLASGIDPANVAEWQSAVPRLVPDGAWSQPQTYISDGDHNLETSSAEEGFAEAAGRWHALGFKPAEAVEWVTALDFLDAQWQTAPDVAADWRSRGFTSRDAESWVRGGVSPGDESEFAELFRDAGWHPFAVWALYELCVRSDDWEADRRKWASLPQFHALSCARAGVPPQEAESLVGTDMLMEYLERRFEARPRIDPHTALRFNHYIVPWEDEPEEVPFWCRRLWDSQDEDDDNARRSGVQPPYGGPQVKKPRWKLLEERAAWEVAEAAQNAIQPCSGSGGDGDLEFRDGMEDWYVHCPVCGTTWMGGNGSPLSIHNRPGEPRYRGPRPS